MNDLQPLDYQVFDGGMADIDTPNDRKTCELLENFDITTTGKLKQRPGSQILDNTASLVSTASGNVRENKYASTIYNYEDDLHLILRSLSNLYAKNAATWDAVTAWTKIAPVNVGFNALPSLRALTASSVVAGLSWNGHELLAGKDESNGAYITPQKVYLDDTNTFQVRNAALPAPADPAGFATYSGVVAHCITMANAIKASLNTHMADLQAHVSATTAIDAADATDESTLITLTRNLLDRYNNHADMQNSGSAHGVDRVLNFGFVDTAVTACLNYQVENVAAPTSAYDCARILNQLLWSVNLHYMAFMAGDTAMTYFPPSTTATFTAATSLVTFSAVGMAENLKTGDQISFYGSVPATLTAGTIYYVIKLLGNTTAIKIATTLANARNGTPMTFPVDVAGGATFRQHQNLHPSPTTAVSLQLAFRGYCYPEGFALASGVTTGDTAGPQYPHISPQLLLDAQTTLAILYNHFHMSATTGGFAHAAPYAPFQFLFDTRSLYNVPVASNGAPNLAVLTEDWQVFGVLVKCYEAFRYHRIENSGQIHVASSTESGTTVLSTSKAVYTTKFNPSPFSATTWSLANTLMTDLIAKLKLHMEEGGTRHVAGSTTFTPSFREHHFAQRRYALVFKYQYKTFKNLLFEDRSAPNFSDSYCIAHVNTLTNNFPPYANAVYILPPRSAAQRPLPQGFENIDATNVRLEIYRTIDGGSVFFLTGSISGSDATAANSPYGIPDFNDDQKLLDSNVQLYTTGGVVPFDPAPRAKSIARADNFVLYGGIVEEAAPRLDIVTFSASPADTVNLTAHGLSAGDAVIFWGMFLAYVGNIAQGKVYFVVNPTANTFQVSLSPGGAIVTIPSIVPAPQDTLYMGRQKLRELKNRVRQSFPSIAFVSPASFYVDLESDTIQVGKAQENFVAICKQGVYRIEGRFDEQGRGGMDAKKISERVGGVSATGGINVAGLFYFMGQDGFYMTDGYKVLPISVHLKQRHLSIATQDFSSFSAQNNNVQATYDRYQNRILWAVDNGATGVPNETWVLHLNQQTEARAPFSVWKNAVKDVFAPTALGYFRGSVIRGDKSGLIFSHATSLTADPMITGNRVAGSTNTDVLASYNQAIQVRARILPEDFGDRGTRKWVSKMLAHFTNNGNLTLALKSINDKAASLAKAMKGIRFRGQYGGIIKEKRTFPTGGAGTGYQGLRCHTKQVEISSDTVILYRSDDYGLLSSTAGVATLGVNWPTPSGGLIEFLIYTELDNYTVGYPITAVAGTSLTATGLPNQAGKKWQINGTPRDETAELLSLTLYRERIESQPNPPSGTSGGNS